MNLQRIRRIASAVAAAVCAAALSGCSALNTGEEAFSCSGMPGSIYCASARDVYEATNNSVVPTPMKKGDAYNEDCEDCVKAEDVNPELASSGEDAAAKDGEAEDADRAAARAKSAERRTLAVTDDELVNNYVTPALPDKPVPIRTPSQVMRIWVAPYVDTNGDLQAPGFVYTEIEPRRWVMKTETDDGRSATAFAPLEDARDYYSTIGREEPAVNSLDAYKEKVRAVR